MNKRALIGVFVFLFLIIPAVYLTRDRDPKIDPVKIPQISLSNDTVESLTQKILSFRADDLPISTVEKSFVSSSKGIAILLPQTHRYPGSEISDGVNDAAVQVQKNLYEIVGRLSTLGVNFVAAEGDLSGVVPTSSIQTIAKKIELKKKFEDLKERFKSQMPVSADRNFVNGFYGQLDKIIAYLDRDVALSGAPYKLKAEGADLSMVGAEDPNTRAKSVGIIRDYYYLNDRLASLNAKVGNSPSLAQSSNISSLLQMFQGNNQTLGNYIQYMKTANTDQKLKNTISDLASAYQDLNEVRSQRTTVDSAPSRADNPYLGISDASKIRELLKQTTDKISDIVLDERNKDAAEIFASSLGTMSLPIGIIQFGAEHKEGLVRELNKRGISVITISPKGLKL